MESGEAPKQGGEKRRQTEEALSLSVAARQLAAATLGFARLPANAIDNTADQQDCEYAPLRRREGSWNALWMLLDGFSAKLRSKTGHFWLDSLGDIWMQLS